MNRGFSKLMAALALFVFMAPSMVGWGQTATQTSFSSTSGNVNNDSKVSYHAYQGGGTTAPGIYSNAIRLYQNSNGNTGGYVVIGVSTGYEIISATIQSTNATTTGYKLTSTAPASTPAKNTFDVNNYSLSANTDYTVNNISTQYITFACFGTSSGTRLNLSKISITYQSSGGGQQTLYTVTLADDNTTLTQSSPGASVTLPTRSAIGAYTFVGWSSTEVADETTTAPTIISAGAYTPTDDITLYPVYTRTEGGGVSPSAFSVGDTGDFAIVSEQQGGKYYALPTNPTLNNGKITAQEITVSELNGVKYVTTTNANGFTWTIASATNGYTLSDGSKYIYHSNGGSSGTNLAYGTSTSFTWAFTIDGDFVKMAGMNGSTTNNRGLLFSGTTIGGYSLSNWGESGYYKSMILPVCASGTTYYWSNPGNDPIISASAPATLAYNATGGEFGYSILNPVTGVTLNAASNSDWITNVAVNANNSTVTFSTSTNTTYTQRTGTITLSYTGATDKVVTITQEAAPDPVITASNVEIAFDATSGSIAYSITNEPTPAGTMTAAVASGGTIANLTIGAIENNAVAFTCAANNTSTTRTATVTLTYTYDNNRTVTKNVTITQAASEFDYAILPFAFDGGRADIENTIGLTQENLGTDYSASPKLKFNNEDNTVSSLVLKINERPGQLSYDIKGNPTSNGWEGTFKVQTSADGVTYTDFATYTDLTSDARHITHNNLAEDVRYIKWVYSEKVKGNVALGNIALDVYQAPQPYTLSVGGPEGVTIIARYGNNQNQVVVNGGSATVYSSTTVTLTVTPDPDYFLDEVTVYDDQENLISLTEVSDNVFSFVMPNSDVTVDASAAQAHAPYYYDLATTLESGRRYIIVAERNNSAYLAMGEQKTNNRYAKPIDVDGDVATVTRSDVFEFTIESIEGEPGYYSIHDARYPGYLYAGSSSKNWLLTDATLNVNGKWEITIDANTGVASIVASGSNYRNVMQFNAGSTLFSCYASANQSPVYLYVKQDGFTFTIDGYTDVPEGEGDNNKGYYLIASPVTVNPADVAGMTEGTFDLYAYDDSQEKEWINWKGDATLGHPGGFDLVPGKGYLYAKKAADGISEYSFTLSGEVYAGDGSIELEEGWNLIGNPYGVEVSLDDVEEYYEMSEDGSELVVGEEYILQPMQGVFVYAEEDGIFATFNRLTSGNSRAGLSLNLSQGASTGSATRGVVDRAIVRFGEGRQLPKFQLFVNSTRLYIPQGDRDYAVVYADNAMGELPVSFKAQRNGTYTLSANLDGVSLDYLHLIDNLTGMDVDLLQTPSYTFEAKTNDYASRFRLVFKASSTSSEADETFAYYNGSSWTVSNLGEATLQVVDVTGRTVSSETINGNATISLNQTPGVYMLRLVNGNSVKVQKVVVR